MKVVSCLSNELTLGIYVPSYKRSDSILTYHLFEYCKYMVRESEKAAYLAAGIKPEDLWAVPDHLIDGGDKAYFYIIDNAPEDIIVIADDDILDFRYMLDNVVEVGKDPEVITSEIERIGQILYDLRIGHAFIGPNAIPYMYDREFAFKGIPGAVKWYNKAVFKGKLDDKVAENFDMDIILQELLVNRICLMPKYLYDKGYMDVNAGGNSSRKRKDQLDSITNMKAKWGKYFEYNLEKNKPKINVDR